MHNSGLLAEKFVFNLQINKNLTFDRATIQWGLVSSNLRLFAGKQAARSFDNRHLKLQTFSLTAAT